MEDYIKFKVIVGGSVCHGIFCPPILSRQNIAVIFCLWRDT